MIVRHYVLRKICLYAAHGYPQEISMIGASHVGPYQAFESIVERTRKRPSPFLKYQKVIFWQWIHEWKGSFFWHGNNLQYQDINTMLEIKWSLLGFTPTTFHPFFKLWLGGLVRVLWFCIEKWGFHHLLFPSQIELQQRQIYFFFGTFSSSTMVLYSGNS